jgi:class 3 adenylate cyclase
MQDTRIVTLLFTDVEASTRLLGSLGDTFVGLIERQRAILTGAAGAHRGADIPRVATAASSSLVRPATR